MSFWETWGHGGQQDSASIAEQVDNVFGSTNYQYLNKQTKDFPPVDIAIQSVSNAT